jgi:DNA-binding protein H-NS
MPKLSPPALRARIEQLKQQLVAAEAQKAPAVRRVRALMEKLGVTVDDLSGSKAAVRRGRRARNGSQSVASAGDIPSAGKTRVKVAAKYRDDKGNSWTGRGKTPRWLVEAEKSGRSREAFRIT